MLEVFYQPLRELECYRELEEHAECNQGTVLVTGCIDPQKTQIMSALNREKSSRLIVACSEQRARELLAEYRFYNRKAVYYPARDILFYQSDIRGNALTRERMLAYQAIFEQEYPVVITTVDSLLEKLIKPEVLKSAVLRLQSGQEWDLEQLRLKLIQNGYECSYQAEQPGQFAVRGGIVDVFPLTGDVPYRIEFWGDEIDSIRSFEPGSQRSMQNLEEVLIYPASELVLAEESLKEGAQKIEAERDALCQKFRREMKTEEAFRLKEHTDMLLEQLGELQNISDAETYLPYFYDDAVSIIDYFGEAGNEQRPLLLIDEPLRCGSRAKALEKEFSESMRHRLEKGYVLPGQLDVLYGAGEVLAKCSRFCSVLFSVLDAAPEEVKLKKTCRFRVSSVNTYNSSFDLLVKDLKHYQRQKYRVLVLCGSRTRAVRMAENLQQENISAFYSEDSDRILDQSEIMVQHGKLARGFEYPELKFVVLTETDIFGAEKIRRKKRRLYEGEKIHSFSELNVGDYVVHENHGLGIYRGIEKVEINKVVKDYIKIEYAKGGNLYILATQLDLIQKYAGSDARKPKLNRLGGQEWVRTKSKVKGAVWEIAQELVNLYAVRQNREGYAYSKDTVWQREFEEMFLYEETEDQLNAIEAVKKDMESRKIMDRLICGDVGYGKTEVAIRAAFKAVQDGKQVAYLVPTTILAQQHYNTFVKRMKDFPVQVDLLCRFKTAGEQKQAIQDLKRGMCDVVIGTHRLLSKDVEFKNLGLLIVDEEQRFGVAHKEKIKQMKKDVDVLTLTATPIPRTLHMSLIGIRDMSVLEEPPNDRMPVQTYVMEYDEEMVREAILRELSRDGQVYYVFNRVNQIEDVAARLAGLVPAATVAFAHGQMHERQLEDIMYRFINGEIDVLVSTTIIETGLDISNANTMIIHDADNMGLSQLYQLRGRIGRSSRTSYAFLMYRRNKMLREVAEKRLSAIREFSELGSGFKIAMKDLEIRGAGNLLGEQQHGHMEAVGYDLYCKMLNLAVKTLKGESSQEEYDTVMDVELDAFIPASYIQNESQKLDIYKRIACIENEDESAEMLDELIDRFGEPPKSVENLLLIAKLKALAHEVYLTEIKETGVQIQLSFYEKACIDPAGIPELVSKHSPNLLFKADSKAPVLYYKRKKGSPEAITIIGQLLTDLKSIVIS